VEGPSGGGTGIVIGRKNNVYTILTAKHVVGSNGDEADVNIPGHSTLKLTIIKRFKNIDAAVGTFSSKESFFVFAINSLLPYPAPKTAEERFPNLNLKSKFNTVTDKGIVAGYSLPSKAIKFRVFRPISMQLVDQTKGNENGYNLLYQASTVRGMSGGPVLAFRDCACIDGQEAGGCNSGGFALGLSPNKVFPILVGIHGMSEDYNGGEGRSGISLGIPVEGELLKYIKSIADRNGIPSTEPTIRNSIRETFCSIPFRIKA